MNEYLTKAFESVQPIWALFIGFAMHVMFPEQAYLAAFCAVVGAMVLDIMTKYRAIASKNGGIWNSIKIGKLNSHSLWIGTSRKIFDYLVISIMVGLSYRVTPMTGIITYLGTTVYLIMFYRECQSIVENLDEMDGNWGWLLRIIKRRKTKIFEEEGVSEDDERV